VARHWKTSGRVKRDGVGERLRVYASSAVHSSIVKAAELLGLGSRAVCSIATLDGTLDVEALETAIEDDLRAGAVPLAVVGNAGTVGLGAIDPLPQLAALCKRRKLWFHVDGAIGALGYLSPQLRPRLAGLELADSLAFDLHKWGQIPYEAGGLLVRDGALHAATFAVDASYLGGLAGGVVPQGSHAFHHYSPGLSRGDRALKVWTTFQAYGVERMIRVFERNVELARYLAARVADHPRFVALHEPALNIVCFRDREGDDASHGRALVELQRSGLAVLSPYHHAGSACYRVALSNHRTRPADLDALLERLALA
jgi:glutamate/tyrosine decarboxylase-like PLP-dependent enzyme